MKIALITAVVSHLIICMGKMLLKWLDNQKND